MSPTPSGRRSRRVAFGGAALLTAIILALLVYALIS
jgi:hypothetical protein